MRIKHVHHTDYIFIKAQWCNAAYEENRMNENRIKGWSNCYRHANGSLPLNGDAALPHERLTYFPLEDLGKNNGKNQA